MFKLFTSIASVIGILFFAALAIFGVMSAEDAAKAATAQFAISLLLYIMIPDVTVEPRR